MRSLKIGDLLVKMPIVQGGMGVGISLSGLSSAVANEGGIGVISSAGLGLLYMQNCKDYIKSSIDGLKEEINKAREKSKKSKGVIGVNIMVALTNFSDMVKTSVKEKADIIFSGAGLPLNLPSFLTEGSKTKLAPIVSSVRALKVIVEKWKRNYDYIPDLVVVEGPKAGGHLGYKLDQLADSAHFNLESILVDVIKQVRIYESEFNRKIPVIAGGGIYTGEDIAKIMELGADGVQLGTRFVTTKECDASDEFKNEYLRAKKEDIVIIKSPVGMPGRAIKNKFLEDVNLGLHKPKQCPYNCIKTCQMEKSPYCIMVSLFNAYKGRMSKGYAFSGTNAWRATKIETVKDVFDSLKEGYEEYVTKKNINSSTCAGKILLS